MAGCEPRPVSPASWRRRTDTSLPVTPEQLDQLATSTRPFVLAAVGGIGLVVIVWLMMFKPF